MRFEFDSAVMQRALTLAQQGFGAVEPNPMVGAVIVNDQRELIADGFHQRFGGPHAEVVAMQQAGSLCRGATLFVTLEPCSHFGKTPPCADAVIQAGFKRVVVGCQDPAPHVAGRGLAKLRDAGISVECGLLQAEAEHLIAPFRKQMLEQRPWVHAKWAMTLDGRIASRTGHSQWISGEESRAHVHWLRGRMDAIITGAGTVRADNPRLTARPPGPRVPLRVVVDAAGTSLSDNCHLVQTAREIPVLACVSRRCDESTISRLKNAGIEVLQTSSVEHVSLTEVLESLGQRQMTHVLLECGPGLLGAFQDQQLIDEVHVFVAPKLVGGTAACPPIGGQGHDRIPELPSLKSCRHTILGQDVLIEGRVR
ncbi:MAG: bifunctional diaminohydroxyphosphoribosylaminopyrimidine deaminase/5-amino-6-(5-phosphoribosylamino)uracil reductase RibD [Planctomycetaceae bacterium]|nr:bifunctional diaminohydroxyphosphoribosylaminopyrimidine deaminase/5-amino-6-(5-phosphoribosylamino)uracil reductase RibD [Planctomycetaceae bacterium]